MAIVKRLLLRCLQRRVQDVDQVSTVGQNQKSVQVADHIGRYQIPFEAEKGLLDARCDAVAPVDGTQHVGVSEGMARNICCRGPVANLGHIAHLHGSGHTVKTRWHP